MASGNELWYFPFLEQEALRRHEINPQRIRRIQSAGDDARPADGVAASRNIWSVICDRINNPHEGFQFWKKG